MRFRSVAVGDLEGALVCDAAHDPPDFLPLLALGSQPERDLLAVGEPPAVEAVADVVQCSVALGVAVVGAQVRIEPSEDAVEGFGHAVSVGLGQRVLKKQLDKASWVDGLNRSPYALTHQRISSFNLSLLESSTPTGPGPRTTETTEKQSGPGACDSYIAHAPALTTRNL